MSTRPSIRTDNFDMDSLFDFNQGTTQPSPLTASGSRADAMSPYDKMEERRQFSGPSHDYHQYKQQVGLPVGSMVNMPSQTMFDGYSSGIGDMGYDSMSGWSTGLDLDADMAVDFANPTSAMPAMFFPTTMDGSVDNFVNPMTVGGHDESTSKVGSLWPGMHSQQAQQIALQKAAQVQAMQQRQVKLQAQQAHYRQSSTPSQSHPAPQQGHGSSKRASHASEPHVEESISRLLNQMRQRSATSDDTGSPDGMLPHIARMKKDEDDMDEDERLLASEEGKKLSSKERRQLRNKVSARAFRSRRKEYISQLEGEVAMKAQEAHSLRSDNQALMQENERYRGLIETLLRHPAFTPFINDISKDPSVTGAAAQIQSQLQATQPHGSVHSQQMSITPTSATQSSEQKQQHQPQQQQQHQQQQRDVKHDFLNFDASQIQIPGGQHHEQQIGVAMVPDDDFSKLKIHGLNHAADFTSLRSVNAFSMTDMSCGPDPLDLLAGNFSVPVLSDDLNILLAKLDGAARQLRGGL